MTPFTPSGHGNSERGEHVPYSMQLYVDVIDGLLGTISIRWLLGQLAAHAWIIQGPA